MKDNATIVQYKGKKYKRIKPPMVFYGKRGFGQWLFYHPLKNGVDWHIVKNKNICRQLDIVFQTYHFTRMIKCKI